MDTTTELLEYAARGDRSAWEGLVHRYSRRVWAVPRAFRLSHADAADVYQATWLSLAEHLFAIRDPEKIGSWLITTAGRLSIRVISLRGRELPTDRWEPTSPGPEDVVLGAEHRRQLWRAWASLDDRCRTLLRIVAFTPELSYLEIARQIGMRVGSVGPTRGRCLAALRRRLGGAS